jgi:hypothetical protein
MVRHGVVRMHYWLFLGILLGGCGVGALLTAVVYLTQLRKVKSDLQKAADSQGGAQTASGENDRAGERRSA